MNSRAKGKRIELEAADFLRVNGFMGARRGVQYSGSPNSPDVVGVPGWHIEVKGCQRLKLDEAINQAKGECGGKPWVILHKKNKSPWYVTLDAVEFLGILKKFTTQFSPGIDEVLKRVTEATNISEADILGEGKEYSVVRARHYAYWLAKATTTYGYEKLAVLFNRASHGSIVHGVQAINDLRLNYPKVKEVTDRLLEGMLWDPSS